MSNNGAPNPENFVNDREYFKSLEPFKGQPIVEELFKQRPSVRFVKAVLSNDIATVGKMLNKGYDPNKIVYDEDEGSVLPIVAAVKAGHVDMVRLLVGAGAKVNQRDYTSTALMAAVVAGNADMVTELLKLGARPETPNWEKDQDYIVSDPYVPKGESSRVSGTILTYAIRKGNLPVVQAILHADPPITLIKHSETTKRISIMDFEEDSHEQTPLLAAIDTKQKKMALELLKAGANPNQAVSRGDIPLEYALYHGENEIAAMLIFHGARYDMEFEGATIAKWAKLGRFGPDVLKAIRIVEDRAIRAKRSLMRAVLQSNERVPEAAAAAKAKEFFPPKRGGSRKSQRRRSVKRRATRRR